MATMWELMGVCFADAEKAEALVRDLAFRRELRVDPEKALAAFVLWRRDGVAPAASTAPRQTRQRVTAMRGAVTP